MEVIILLALPLIFLHMLPTWVALSFRHRNLSALATLNLLTGWSVAGWLITLTWALWPMAHDKYQLSRQ